MIGQVCASACDAEDVRRAADVAAAEAAEAAARRREDFQSEARPGFIESVVTVCPVEG